ncbi:MAG: vWA domain-containing protein [Planctomycetota bacterium]
MVNNQKATKGNFQTIVTGGLTRPSWICKGVKQAAVLVRDASPSMCGKKATDAEAASIANIQVLAQPENKDGFEVAIVDFSGSATVVRDLTPATQLAGQPMPIDTNTFFGGTNITAGLEKALEIVTQVENSQVQHLRSVVLLFSDGCHNTGSSPEKVADQLKQKVDLVAIAFGSDADENLLKKLASTPQHFYRCQNGRDLRQFFGAIGATMAATRTRGQNATQALGQIKLG